MTHLRVLAWLGMALVLFIASCAKKPPPPVEREPSTEKSAPGSLDELEADSLDTEEPAEVEQRGGSTTTENNLER